MEFTFACIGVAALCFGVARIMDSVDHVVRGKW
jgi:hypothetical protein